MKTHRAFVPIEEAERNCDFHGGYTTTLFECQPSEAPIELRQHWTNCPPCNDEWEKEAKAVDLEMKNGTTAKEERRLARQEAAGVPRRFAANTVWDWLHPMPKQHKAWVIARDYCHGFSTALAAGSSLALCGHPGTGKTHLAIGILMHVMESGWTGRYSTVMDMLGRIKDTYNRQSKETEEAVISELTSVDLLVIDEVGKQLDTNYETAQLFRIIDTRYREMKPIILVSNLRGSKFVEFVGAAVADRLRDNGGKVLSFDWGSHRGRRKES
jgi:DNA replication protein DnaC